MKEKSTLAELRDGLRELKVGETICVTFEDSDNIKKLLDAISYQLPLKVTEYTAYATGAEGIFDSYELCPKCGLPLEHTYQQFCDKCGQALEWASLKNMTQKDS